MLSFDASSGVHENGSQTFNTKQRDSSGVEVLSELCQQIRNFRRMVYS